MQYIVVPYGSVEEILGNKTTRFAVMRPDSTLIADLAEVEAKTIAMALEKASGGTAAAIWTTRPQPPTAEGAG